MIAHFLRVATAVAVIVLQPPIVGAQPKPVTPSPGNAYQATAKKLVAAGIAAQDAKDYDKAIEFYTQAFNLVPHPILLFNIAQAHRLANRPDRAARFYEEYLLRDPNGKEAATTRAILATLPKAAPTDGDSGADRSGGDSKSDQQDLRRETVEPGKPEEDSTEPLPMNTDSTKEATDTSVLAAQPSSVSDTSLRTDTTARPGRTLRIAGIAAGVIGVACVGVALGFGLRVESIEKEISGNITSYDEKARAGEAAERNQYIAATLAGTFIVGGVVLYWVGYRQGRATQTTALVPIIGPDFAGIAMTGALP